MKSTIRFLIIFTIGTGSLFQACKKETGQIQASNDKAAVDPNLVFRKPETAAEKDLVLNLEKIMMSSKMFTKAKKRLKKLMPLYRLAYTLTSLLCYAT